MPGRERFLEEGKRLVDAIAGFNFVFLTQLQLRTVGFRGLDYSLYQSTR
jgi:hypothetical protein